MTTEENMRGLSLTWKLISTSNKPIGRSSHSISVIKQSKDLFCLYVIGGENVARVPLVCQAFSLPFKLEQLTSTTTTTTSPLSWRINEAASTNQPKPTLGNTINSINQDLYFFGGRSEQKESSGLFKYNTTKEDWENPSDGKTTTDSPHPKGRSYHSSCSHGSKLFVFGGCSAEGRVNDLHCYDSELGQWEILHDGAAKSEQDSVPIARGGSSLGCYLDDNSKLKVLLFGGFNGKELDDLFEFDVEKKTWSKINPKGDLPPGRSVLGMSALNMNGSTEFILYGGEEHPSSKGHAGAGDFSQEALLYRPRSQTFVRLNQKASSNELEDLPGKRGWFAMCSIPDTNSFLLHGGLSVNNERLDDLYIGTVN